MMTKNFLVVFECIIFISLFFLSIPSLAGAFFDPLSRPNNFSGIHILFPSELSQAAHLVNSSNGAWGYVTIPIQKGDMDLVKWQDFMDESKKLKLIPIVRLATQADRTNTAVWAKPTATDILDFANFLSSLNWPVENRYIIVFNEMNRFDEWGGEAPNPIEYTGLLLYTSETFKERSQNFYIIMGGLDNAAPNDRIKYMNNFVYIREMEKANPEIFKKIDGFSSHSYPNPGFIAPPLSNKLMGVTTYQYEYNLINSFSDKKVPVFITETGWDSSKLAESVVADYFKQAYDNFWNKDKDKIVAITPFLLNSSGGAFDVFSFVKEGRQTQYYKLNAQMEKTKGEPLLEAVKGIATKQFTNLKKLVIKKEPDRSLGNQLVIEWVKFFF